MHTLVLAHRPQPSRSAWRAAGGCAFPCPPDAFAADIPAIWQPACSPTTVILDAAPAAHAHAVPIDLAAWPIKLVDRKLSDGRHVILGDVDGPHRLWLRTPDINCPVAYVIVRDEAIDLRYAAVRRLDRRLAGAPPSRALPGFQPTPFQRHRFSLLLDILDAIGVPADQAPTTHEIGTRLVYPGEDIGRGHEWKSSSERRRTQRLIDEAIALMKGGYLRLLQRNRAGATKRAR